jgi:acyl-homoserine-lactone acylase
MPTGSITTPPCIPKPSTPGLLPITGKDIEAGFVFKQPFFYGLDTELKAITAPGGPPPPPKGSNGLAIAPSRNADGATRLLVNSHQPYTGPVAWYEAVVESGQGWHVAGGFFPGAPFMLHGHNATLGWANTVSKPDLVDIYKLTINPQNKNQYRLDGAWRDFDKTTATLRVKLWGPIVLPVRKAVLRSVHGPVLETKSGVFAIRYAGMGEYRQPQQFWALNKARTVEEWRAAIATHALPSLNYIYGDAAGNIGFVHNGQYPNRTVAADWAHLLPGDRSDLIWQGYLPVEKSPQLWNPKSGFVFNSNNTPVPRQRRGRRSEARRLPGLDGLADQHDQPRPAHAGDGRRRSGHHRRELPPLQVRPHLQRALGPGWR